MPMWPGAVMVRTLDSRLKVAIQRSAFM